MDALNRVSNAIQNKVSDFTQSKVGQAIGHKWTAVSNSSIGTKMANVANAAKNIFKPKDIDGGRVAPSAPKTIYGPAGPTAETVKSLAERKQELNDKKDAANNRLFNLENSKGRGISGKTDEERGDYWKQHDQISQEISGLSDQLAELEREGR